MKENIAGALFFALALACIILGIYQCIAYCKEKKKAAEQ